MRFTTSKICTATRTDVTDMSTDVRTDMSTDMSTDMRTDVSTDVCRYEYRCGPLSFSIRCLPGLPKKTAELIQDEWVIV